LTFRIGIFSGYSGNKQSRELRLSAARRGPENGVEERMKAILFVDDHEVLARLSCEILEMHGYRAVSAFNAKDALDKFDRDKFDILVTDIRMPNGREGMELAKQIHAKSPTTPIIIVTGYPQDYQKSESNDVAACLPKTELFPQLLEKIKLFLGDAEPRERETAPAQTA
jgi:DNA-binding NtrC family response regulator